MLRTDVQVGAETQLGHTLTVERATRIGREMRCSPCTRLARTTLTTRHTTGDLPRIRDSALVTIGRAHAQLVTPLLGAVIASHLVDTHHDLASTAPPGISQFGL